VTSSFLLFPSLLAVLDASAKGSPSWLQKPLVIPVLAFIGPLVVVLTLWIRSRGKSSGDLRGLVAVMVGAPVFVLFVVLGGYLVDVFEPGIESLARLAAGREAQRGRVMANRYVIRECVTLAALGATLFVAQWGVLSGLERRRSQA
jgi:hypothetical protein